jgi:ribosomal protein L16 Arg81 hydroxylase
VRHFVLYTNVKNYDSIYRYYEKNNKGEYIMSKVKQWAEDMAEQKVDSIISNLKDGQIDLDTAKVNILNTENKQMLGINSENVDEVIEETLNA